jgi:hypothetical protein
MPRLTSSFEIRLFRPAARGIALGWLVALKAPDGQVKDEQHQQQGANDPGGEDAWLSSPAR